ncbi:MAG: translation elongation factor Ts [Bacillota bacterium]
MIDKIKDLRKSTGAGVMDIKKALDEVGGDVEKASELLRKQGFDKAEKRSERETEQGIIDAYVHLGRIGVLVEVNCETDFVARNEDFKNFVHEVALQIAQSSTQDVDGLLKEEYFRNPEQTINDLLRDIIVKTGENIRIKRFSRFILGG